MADPKPTSTEDGKRRILEIIASAKPFPPLEIAADPPKPVRSRQSRAAKREGETVEEVSDIKPGGSGGVPPAEPPLPSAAGGDKPPPEILEMCAREPLNDTGNGKRLLLHFGAVMFNVREVGWHAWTGTHWEREGGGEIAEQNAQKVAARIALEADMLAATRREAVVIEEAEKAEIEHGELLKAALLSEDQERRKHELEAVIARGRIAKGELSKRKVARRKYAISSGNGGKLESMLKRAMVHCTVKADEIDPDPLAFNVQNGTLRFRAVPDPDDPDDTRAVARLVWRVELGAHDPGDRITKLAPVDYDPDAEAPEWHKFLALVQPKPEMRSFLQRFHGYALTGLTDAQAFVFHHGSGANGKSTFIDALCRLFGPYAHTLNPESIAGAQQRGGNQATPDLALLPGKRLLRISEMPERAALQDNLVKQVTGGEPLNVRHNYGNFFEFKPEFKAAMSGNAKPNINDISEGFWRRIMLVPWAVMIPLERRRGFEEMQIAFAKEYSGILNWLLEGCLDYLNTRRLDPPEDVLAATAEHREDLDPVGQFIESCLVRLEGHEIGGGRLHEYFLGWCVESGVRPLTLTKFGRDMQKHQLEGKPILKKMSGTKRTINYQDVGVLPSAPAPRTPNEVKMGNA